MVDYDDIDFEDKMSVDWSDCEHNHDDWIDHALMDHLEYSYEEE